MLGIWTFQLVMAVDATVKSLKRMLKYSTFVNDKFTGVLQPFNT
jgi:hypothetical protein